MIEASEVAQNIALAFEIGMKVPETIFLNSLTADKQFEIVKSPEWEIVTPGLVMKIPGVFEATASAFWNGESFSFWLMSLKDKYLLSGSQGGKLEENCQTIFYGKMQGLKKQFKFLAEKNPDYRGFINIDFTPIDGKLYYKRIWYGAFWDFLHALSELHGESIEVLFDKQQEEVPGFACSTRLYSIPYNPELNMAFDVTGYDVRATGECYVAVGKGDSIKKSWHDLYNRVTGINRLGLCYRIDGDLMARRIYAYLKKEKYL